MKKTFFVFMLLSYMCLPTNAQNTATDDFEGNGTISTWFGDDCGMDNNFSNPFQEGINTSDTVLQYEDEGGQYANVRFDADGFFQLAENSVFSLKIYVPSSEITGNQNNQVSLKLQDNRLGAPWSTQSEIIKPITLNQWQTVSFDFANDTYFNLDDTSLPPTDRTDFNRIVLQVNGENNNDFVDAYFDDFVYEGVLGEDTTEPEEPIIDNDSTEYVFETLIWSDEFDTDGEIDESKWFQQKKLPDGGSWFNGELQHYTDRVENSFVENGNLKIVAIKENFTDQGVTKDYTSARLNSKFAFQYGRVEVKAKLPTGAGTWPAIWTLGKNITENGAYWQTQGFGTTGWPACGEIDIMEHWGTNQNFVQSAMHTPSSFGNTENIGGQVIPTASTDFHVYALEWTPSKMVFSVDDVVHYIYNPEEKNAETWPFNAEQYLLLNVAIQASIIPNFTQSAMEIDYVRIYEATPIETTETNTDNLAEQPIKFYPNPADDVLTVLVENKSVDSIDMNISGLDGKLLKTVRKTIADNKIIVDNLSELQRGIYLLSFKINEQNYSFRFLKN